MVEVLIVGAGPAGSAAAIQLARAGHEVLLLDRYRFPRPKPCGEYYNPACCSLLRELGVLGAVLAAGARPIGALIIGAPGLLPLRVPVDRIARAGEPALSLGREVLDALLVQAAVRAGARLIEGTLVRAPLVEQGMVRGAAVRCDGRERDVRAQLTLAADGIRSRFARCLGLGRGDGGRRKLGITARYRVREGAEERVEMIAGDPGCCGLAVRGSEANLGMVADIAHSREIGGDPQRFFRRSLSGFPGLATDLVGEPEGVRMVGPLTWRTSRQAVSGCMLLGDAAGFYDPFTGEGVTFALRTAALAASVGSAALREGDVSARRLGEYSRRRRAAIEPRVLLQRAIQGVIERPTLLEHVLGRLRTRPHAAETLLGVIADVLPVSEMFRPRLLAGLL